MINPVQRVLVSSLLLLVVSQSVAQEECAECTQVERDQLRIRAAHRMALSLKELLEELKQLSRYPEAASLLLADDDQLLRNRLKQVLTAIQSVNNGPVPGAVATQDKTPETRPSPALRGLQGLTPAYAQPANDFRGIQAAAIVLSDGRAWPLSPGSKFRHNGNEYEMKDVRRERKPGGDGAFEILLERGDGKMEILRWQ